MSQKQVVASFLVLLVLVSNVHALWLAQRYDYPKQSVLTVAQFGLESGGSFVIDVSFKSHVEVKDQALVDLVGHGVRIG